MEFTCAARNAFICSDLARSEHGDIVFRLGKNAVGLTPFRDTSSVITCPVVKFRFESIPQSRYNRMSIDFLQINRDISFRVKAFLDCNYQFEPDHRYDTIQHQSTRSF